MTPHGAGNEGGEGPYPGGGGQIDKHASEDQTANVTDVDNYDIILRGRQG